MPGPNRTANTVEEALALGLISADAIHGLRRDAIADLPYYAKTYGWQAAAFRARQLQEGGDLVERLRDKSVGDSRPDPHKQLSAVTKELNAYAEKARRDLHARNLESLCNRDPYHELCRGKYAPKPVAPPLGVAPPPVEPARRIAPPPARSVATRYDCLRGGKGTTSSGNPCVDYTKGPNGGPSRLCSGPESTRAWFCNDNREEAIRDEMNRSRRR